MASCCSDSANTKNRRAVLQRRLGGLGQRGVSVGVAEEQDS